MFTHELDSYPNRINKLENMIIKNVQKYERKPTAKLQNTIEEMLKEKNDLTKQFNKINADNYDLFVKLVN